MWGLLSLEPDVLQRFCGPAVEPRGRPVLAPASREIAEGDPAASRWLGDVGQLGVVSAAREPFVSLVQAILFHEGATQHQLSIADLD